VRFLLDTNVVSDLVRNPRGRTSDHIALVGEQHVGTSIIVAAELRYGAAKKGSARLSTQLEKILDTLKVAPFEAPADMVGCVPGSKGPGKSLARTIC
jgi:tRNA(fMet)-specific endonuclease VapC